MIEKNIKTSSVLIRATPLMETLTGIMIAGFYSFSRKLIAAGELGCNFFIFSNLMMLAYQPIRSLATINMVAHQGATAFKRISKIIDKEITIKENINLPNLILKNSDIAFKNVFKYQSTDKQTIKNINFKINGGTMAALVGHSGKKHNFKSNTRFYDPQDGFVEIDNQDISKIKLSSLRKNISLVKSDVILLTIQLRQILLMQKMMQLMTRLKKPVDLQQQMSSLINFQINMKP